MWNRKIINKIEKEAEYKKIQILIWTRQVWKTTILNQIQNNLIKKWIKNIYLDLELENNLKLFSDLDTEKLIWYLELKWFKKWEVFFLLIDEFQIAKDITKIFKIIYDHYGEIQIIATWSSSLLINKFLKEWLTWRKINYKIYPLSYEEFSITKSKDFQNYLSSDSNFYFPEFEKYFFEFLKFWSYPEILSKKILEEKMIIFRSIFEPYIDKDISFFIKKENTPKFKNLVKALALQVWNLVNKNELSSLIWVSSKTIDSYLFTLEQTFIISSIPPFIWDKRKEISKMNKIYFNDLWLRNYVINNFEIDLDIWNLVENFVFLEILKNKKEEDEILFWRTKNWTEIDFILRSWNKIIPIEVKYRNNPFKAIKNIKSFIDQYNPKKAFVLTKDYFWKENYNWTEIIFSPVIKWVSNVFNEIN